MPHIRFRKIEENHVAMLSEILTKSLSDIIECDSSWLTFEHTVSQSYFLGNLVKGEPFIEVLWFERSQEVKDLTAKCITEAVLNLTHSKEITVVFVPLETNNYYENGVHF